MTSTVKHDSGRRREPASKETVERRIEEFAQLVAERVHLLANGKDRLKIIALAERALHEALAAFSEGAKRSDTMLPVAKLKTADVISQGLVALSQASLYRSVDNQRFYCTTPNGRSIGREFPAWQFVEPVPELLRSVLAQLAGLPSSEIHAFWVTAKDEFNALSPAEVLAGKPFETRTEVNPTQRQLLTQSTSVRLSCVREAAALHAKGMAAIIG